MVLSDKISAEVAKLTCQIILIRGNSGSGKTTLAQSLRGELPDCMLISQDVVRKQMLDERDRPGNKSIGLMQANINWALQNVRYLIIEGILRRDVYGQMLSDLRQRAGANLHTYYFDLTFATCAARNQQKPRPFPEAWLRKWWQQDDQLGFEDGTFTASVDFAEQVAQIRSAVQN